MARSTCYFCLARLDLLLTEYTFHIHYIKKGLGKLLYNFYRDPTVRSKVIALTNRYSSLVGPNLLLNEYRLHIHYKEKCIRKLL
jgi:hypothetical protein